jgi:hypothetical protein
VELADVMKSPKEAIVATVAVKQRQQKYPQIGKFPASLRCMHRKKTFAFHILRDG